MGAELHPEETLDRALTGTLSGFEQQELDRHLAGCRACSAHMALSRASRRIYLSEPRDQVLNRVAVDKLMAAMVRTRWPSMFSVLVRRRWAFITAGALFTVGSVASAAWWHRLRSEATASPIQDVPSAIAPASRPRRAARSVMEAPPAEAPEVQDEQVVARKQTRTQASAAALFEEASTLRDHDKPEQAVAVFRNLQRAYPRARETRLSFALAGRILLDAGHPAQALWQFDRHLALDGEASEEALAGRATALGRMGRFSAERATWRRLLDTHPETVYANQARDRLMRSPVSSGVSPTRKPYRSADGVGRTRAEDSR